MWLNTMPDGFEQPDGWDDEPCDQPIRNGDGERCTLTAGHDEPCREDS